VYRRAVAIEALLQADDEPGDLFGTLDRPRRRRRARRHESLEQADAGGFRDLKPLVVLAHALARAVHDLPAGRFGLAEERRDIAVAGVEDVVQQECRPLVRC
jgi:hypothetical protein